MAVLSITPVEVEGAPISVEVTFSCRDGSIRVYAYTGLEAEAILAGASPSSFSGTRIV